MSEGSVRFETPPQFRVVRRQCHPCAASWYTVENLNGDPLCPGCHGTCEIIEILYDGGRNLAASELGRRGGSKGGRARAAALTSKRRSAISRTAARARWKKRKGPDGGEGPG